jgi:UPF0176 protein
MSNSFVVAALYQFTTLDDFESLQKPLLTTMLSLDIKGTLLLAHEGINGTVAGTQVSIDKLLNWIRSDIRLANVDAKFSYDDSIPFYRTRVKLKKEIVSMNVENIDPINSSGTYVKPKDWNALISDPDVVLVDTRNDYESAIGTFKNSIIPNTTSFREFPYYSANELSNFKQRKVAMFCTGGIRCEKSTAYLKQQGFEEVYHLQGGILKYLEDIPESESLWEGECFVFDNRVTVNHSLEKGNYDQCHACRLPITVEDKKSNKYRQGVSCPSCYNKKSDIKRLRFKEREKQVQLAKQRGEPHIGSAVKQIAAKNKTKKDLAKRSQPR